MPRAPRPGVIAAAIACTAPTASAQMLLAGMNVPGQLIVAPADGPRGSDALDRAMHDLGYAIVDRDAVSGALLIDVPRAAEDQLAAALTRRADVAFAERNAIGSGGLVPNDSAFGSQWHHVNTGQSGGQLGADIQSDLAWDITTGSSDVVIAVLDSGTDFNHPDLLGRHATGGFDFVDEDPDPTADHPHGTWAAGMIAANADNNFAAAGIDWNAQVLTVKVLNNQNLGTTFDLVQGLNFVATNPDVDIVSLSLIGYPGTTSLINAIANVRNSGQIVIACAGNGGIGNADISWPGASPSTISIGASNRDDNRAGFSGTGAALDFVAPGDQVISLRWNTSADVVDSIFGCSFATPLTAGVTSLLLARADELALQRPTHDDVRALLQLGAEDEVGFSSEDTPGRDDFHGDGRINAYRSLLAVTDCDANGVLDVTDIRLDDSLDINGDLILDTCQAQPEPFATLSPTPGATDVPIPVQFAWEPSQNADEYNIIFVIDSDTPAFVTAFTTPDTSFTLDANDINPGTTYTWTVTATNEFGSLENLQTFTTADADTPCPEDLDGDDSVGPDDLFQLLASFGIDANGDVDGDNTTGPDDLFQLLAAFGTDCP